MSSILEALKKVEDQKQLRRRVRNDIATEILKGGRERGENSSVRPLYFWILSLLLVSAASIALTLLFIRKGERPPADSSTVQEKAKVVSVQKNEMTEQTPGIRTVSPVKKKEAPAGKSSVRENKQIKKGEAIKEAPIPPESRSTAPIQEKDSGIVQKSERRFTLSGIGWQKDAASRYAVINGTAVGEGGSVDGAAVVEIRPDAVKLRRNGIEEEIHLGK